MDPYGNGFFRVSKRPVASLFEARDQYVWAWKLTSTALYHDVKLVQIRLSEKMVKPVFILNNLTPRVKATQ